MNSSWISLTVLLSIFLFVDGVSWSTNQQEKILTHNENDHVDIDLSSLRQKKLINLNGHIDEKNKNIIIDKNDDGLGIKKISTELEDLEKSFVHPKDDDDVADDSKNKAELIMKNSTVAPKSMEIKYLKNDTLPPKLFPTDPVVVKSILNYSPEIQEKLNHEYNVTDFREKNLSIMKSNSDVKILANMIEQTTMRISTRRKPTADEKTLQITETREQMILKNDNLNNSTNKKSTHPGVIAMLVAILFAIVSSFGYVGLMIWKRYLEYKHGNRELLVNDFDSNDINNFEL
ncbi:uncharacterized protein LOC122850287 [Aphidius gifuensis]|uniref:uncharacterized protein LOC122850287 n=1 Tax=Aphidius gifuensis TaxID=684658 RepID=UPI001CDCE522|nr:uncharacterized protein LOC122850287 [Aphidius gifuensis]